MLCQCQDDIPSLECAKLLRSVIAISWNHGGIEDLASLLKARLDANNGPTSIRACCHGLAFSNPKRHARSANKVALYYN